jgi:hypothetical protein
MTAAERLQVGNLRPNGSREITISDERGVLLHGELGPEPTGQVSTSPRLSLDDIGGIVAMAGRAPSVHNTQPWRFRACGSVVELYADEDRHLRRIDPARREMLISCGAALFGLRLGLRKLGYQPHVEVMPDLARPSLIARVWPGDLAKLTRHEVELLAALPHRHTHRGPFTRGDVPDRLVAGMRMDALAEGAELVLIEQPGLLADLVELVVAAAREHVADPAISAELRNWVHASGSQARDGIRAEARVQELAEGVSQGHGMQEADHGTVRLPQRDFGRPGTEDSGGCPPSVTAVLVTATDMPADWVHAGQSLHRMLLHAATRWVFASLQSQPLESPAWRAELRARLDLPGEPQLLLQFGRANTAPATARRPAFDVLDRDDSARPSRAEGRSGRVDPPTERVAVPPQVADNVLPGVPHCPMHLRSASYSRSAAQQYKTSGDLNTAWVPAR